jgi:hypothetical protein
MAVIAGSSSVKAVCDFFRPKIQLRPLGYIGNLIGVELKEWTAGFDG